MSSMSEQVAKRKKAPPNKRPRAEVIRELLAKGWTGSEIARKLAPNDARRRKVIRGQVARVAEADREYQEREAMLARQTLTEGLDGAAQALVKRAHRGRPDAIKLLFEAHGFHNPKVKHEHSGDIEIRLAMPRPAPVDNPALASGPEPEVVDADVVEE